jgi:hypothetical protein
MLPEVVIVPAIFGIPSAVIALRLWLNHKERMARLTGGTVASTENDPRMARVEQAIEAIEAIAVEMERLGEGQRFLTKLLAERASTEREQAALSPPPSRDQR